MAFTAQCSAINFLLLAKFSSPSTSLWVFHMLFSPCVGFEGIFSSQPEKSIAQKKLTEKGREKTKEMWMKFWWLGRRKEKRHMTATVLMRASTRVCVIRNHHSIIDALSPVVHKVSGGCSSKQQSYQHKLCNHNKTTSRCQNKARRWVARRSSSFSLPVRIMARWKEVELNLGSHNYKQLWMIRSCIIAGSLTKNYSTCA